MSGDWRRLAAGAGAAVAVGGLLAALSAGSANARSAPSQHVLLISVDGLHQTDLEWYVNRHPSSALATLVQTGVSFSNAKTPFPSDSFPGMVAQVTGGNPKTTGVYYDDPWNRAVYPAGTSSCTGPKGAEVTYFEQLDKDQTALDAGQGLSGLPDSILNMTSNPLDVIDPAQLPVDAGTCQPIYPTSTSR